MIRFDELAKAAAGYLRHLQQTFWNFQPMHLMQTRGPGSLRRAHNDLQAAVLELQRQNETLRVDNAELKRVQESARLADEGLQAIIDTIPALVARRGADGKLDYVNQTWRTFTGLAQGSPQRYEVDAFHPEDRARIEQPWLLHLSKGEPFEAEYRLRRADGEYRWLSVRRLPLRDNSGKITAWYGVGYDIEDRKRAESELRESKAYVAEAQKLSHTGSFGWNVSSGELSWSEETFRIFGYDHNTSVTIELLLNRVHPEDRALVRKVIDRAATNKDPFDFEHRVQMPDGSIKHLHIVAHALIDEPHNLHFAGAVMDITAHKHTEQALRHSEKRYQTMFQAMSVSLWELDYSRAGEILRSLYASGVVDLVAYFRANPEATRELLQATRVVDVNDHTVALFGRGSKKDLLTDIEPYWPEESWDDYIAAVVTSFGGNKFSTETRLRKLDGTIFDAHMTTWYASEDKTTGLIGIVDITARKQAFSKLESSERRYRDLFQYMPIGLVQVDATKLIPLFKELRERGVTDLKTYIDEHPEVLPRAVEALEVEEVNQHTVKLFGARSAAEMRGPITRYWQPGIPTLRRSIEARYRGQENFEEETKVARMDGTAIDVLYTSARAGPRADKSLVGLIDITERKQAEEGLRRSEQRYRHLFHHMPVALWQLNARGVLEQFKQLRTEGVADLEAHFDAHPDFVQRCMEMLIIEEVNEHTVLMLGGRDTSEFVGTSVADYFPKGSPTFRRSMVSRYRGDPNYAAETKLLALDGRAVDVLYTASRVGPIGEPGMSLLGVIDITERKQAEEGLRRSEQRYQNLFQAMAVAFFEFDFSGARDLLRRLRSSGITDFRQHFKENPETVREFMRATRVLEVNDQTIALLGGGSRDGLLDNVEPFWPEESIQAYAETILSALERKPSFSIETPLSRTDGSVFDGHFTVWYSAEQPTRGLGGVIDISERVKAQRMLNQVRTDFAHAARISMLGELTASIAHETNQPLAAIAASGEASLRWLARATPDIEEVRELTKSVVADARRASEIIGRVRSMAAGRAPVQALLSLDDLIGEALLFLRHEVTSRGVTVSHIPAFDPQNVFGDRTQLQQVIVNLAVNAMQAMAQSGSTKRNISIRTVAHDSTTLRCSVEDSGPGIEPLHIARLFDSFFTTKTGGMGMGLRICRSIIEAHGGRIAADNDSAQGGARLYFTLPIATAIA